MTWSHDRVLVQATEKLTRLRIAVKLLPTWFDIDTIEDLERLQIIADPAIRRAMKKTCAFLKQLK
jgi:glycosyltransferase A (GT-A) superfamily protein (DUF2064 family)